MRIIDDIALAKMHAQQQAFETSKRQAQIEGRLLYEDGDSFVMVETLCLHCGGALHDGSCTCGES